MEIKKLKSEIIANIRSSSTINNVTQCVTELVLNSLDSKSTSIAVRVNLVTFKIQVVDNGEGITKTNLELVGLRYMTNKCDNLVHLEKHIKYHGFRGEALASIIDLSKKVNITSKHISSTETYAKNFSKHTDNQITYVKSRPSFGTTVTVEGFLYNLPIRKKRIVPELELEDIKRSIESVIIMYPNVSFSVRNDLSGDLIINNQKTKDIISAFKYLHPKIDEEFSLMKVSKDRVAVEALLFKSLVVNKHLQYVYVNRRPVHCSKIEKFVSNLFFKNKNFDKRKPLNGKIVNDKNKHPIYVINIKCPHSHVDILLNPSKTLVEFKNWTIVLQCLEKLIYTFFGNRNKLIPNDKYLTVRKEFKSGGGVSQIYGACKSYGYKRKQPEEEDQVKVQEISSQNNVIIEESDFSADDQFAVHTIRPRSDFIHKDPLVDVKFKSSQQFSKHEKYTKDDKNSSKMFTEDEQVISLFLDESRKSVSQKLKKLPVDKIETISDNDIYISDTTPAKKPKVKLFKKPLPIKIKHKNSKIAPYIDENKNCSINDDIPPIQPILKQIVAKKLDDEKSTLSKFTADENKGKNLIMDMFLKSTQVYSTEEDNQSDTRSDETILEVESNFVLENNIQTKVNGFSKTMSMSVNIRSTKRIKKQKFKANRTEKTDKISKCVQTTLDGNRMISKCVQTTMDQNFSKSKSKLRCGGLSDILVGKKPAENYTIVLADSKHPEETPHFKFVYRNPSRFPSEPINKFTTSNNCKCNCHLNASKMFHFVGSVYKKNKNQTSDNVSHNNIDIFGTACDFNEIELSSIEKPHIDSEVENYEDIKHKERNLTQAEVNRFVQNFGQHELDPLRNVQYKNYGPVKLHENDKTENYNDIKHSAKNPTQAEMNQFIQNYDQYKHQPRNNVLHKNYEPIKLRKDDKTENYKDIKHTVRNPMQVEMNQLVQNCGNLNTVRHGKGETENYKGFKHSARNPMQTEMKQFVKNYGQQNHVNNVVFRDYEPIARHIPNIIQKPQTEGFLLREQKNNTNLQGMFGFDRSPYFAAPHNTLRLNRFNEVNLAPYPVKSKDFVNIVPNNLDSYLLFDPQYRSTQARECNKDTNLENVNNVYKNRLSNVSFTPYSVKDKDFVNVVSNNADSYGLFEPKYRSTQAKDYNKDVNLENVNRVYKNRLSNVNFTPYSVKDKDFVDMGPNNADSYLLFEPKYRSTQAKDYNKDVNLENVNRVYKNRLSNVNFTPYSVKDKDFVNMGPNNADSYILFDPQYCSTQERDYNMETNLDNVNKVYENKFNRVNFTPYPVKDQDFPDMVPNNADSYILFDPQYRSTQLRSFNTDNALNLKICGDRGTKDPLQAENVAETDFTIDHFGNFQPVYKSTQHDHMKWALMRSFQPQNDVHTSFAEYNQSSFINVSEDVCDNFNPLNRVTNFADNLQSVCDPPSNFDRKMENVGLKEKLQCKTFTLNKQNNSNPHFDLDPTRQAIQRNISSENAEINQKPAAKATILFGHSDEQLIISLSNQEKQELLKKELEAERDLNAKQYLEWDSLSEVSKLQDPQPSDCQEFGNEWIKRKNNFGSSFYINKRTGFTTFYTPKLDGNQFKFGRRFEFMPKGLSPILKKVKQVDRSLNQNDKEKLQDYILESHQNELLIVKWQNYIKHNDPKTFFDEVYKEKLKLFEDCLPKINALDKKCVSELDDVMHFNKTLFDSINVIGQVDGKFIAVIEKTKDLLILFDQHAVHERIRLEELLKVYTNSKSKWVEKLVFFLPQNDLSLLKKHELYLSTLGLSIEFFVNGINVLEIPLCIYNKFKVNDDQNSLSEVIQLLINEIIELLKETRGVSFGNLPRLIQNVINLEACRGAIKFGDNLSKKDCMDLLDRLAVCKLPFQCAHGRPTLTPLVRLNLTHKCVPYKVNFKTATGVPGV